MPEYGKGGGAEEKILATLETSTCTVSGHFHERMFGTYLQKLGSRDLEAEATAVQFRGPGHFRLRALIAACS